MTAHLPTGRQHCTTDATKTLITLALLALFSADGSNGQNNFVPDTELLVIGGQYAHEKLQVYNPIDSTKNRVVGDGLNFPIMHHVAAIFNESRAVVLGGGQVTINGKKERSSKTWVLNLDNWQVHQYAPFTQIRSGAGAVSINDQAYVCGGVNGTGIHRCVHRTCERLEKGVYWKPITPMNEQRGTFALAGDEENMKIYAMGGERLNRGQCTNTDGTEEVQRSAEFFDLRTEKWLTIAPMLQPRFAHAAAAYKGRVYVCGGHVALANSYGDDLAGCEMYDPGTKRWTPFAKLNRRRANHAMVVVGSKLYVIGGSTIPNDANGHEFHGHDYSLVSVEEIDLDLDPMEAKWKLRECNLKQPTYAPAAVLMHRFGSPKPQKLVAAGASNPFLNQGPSWISAFLIILTHSLLILISNSL